MEINECNKCQRGINFSEPFGTINGKKYCIFCLRCNSCHQALNKKMVNGDITTTYEKDGLFYCGECKEAIEGKTKTYQGCYRCHKTFTRNETIVRERIVENGKETKETTFCKPCHKKKDDEGKGTSVSEHKFCKFCGYVGCFTAKKNRKLNRAEYRN
jgi:hypothetical protein